MSRPRPFVSCCGYEVDYARELFTKGLPLIDMVDRELALDLDLFSRGGLEILRAIERRQYDVLTMRPVISKSQKAGAVGACALAANSCLGLQGKAGGVTPEVQAAYAACRAIARKKAKNFYYAFVALPASKRDAICAVYAFMRQADDLSDDESLPIADRRVALDAGWTIGIRRWRARPPAILSLSRCWMRNAALPSRRSCWISWYKAQPRISNPGSPHMQPSLISIATATW